MERGKTKDIPSNFSKEIFLILPIFIQVRLFCLLEWNNDRDESYLSFNSIVFSSTFPKWHSDFLIFNFVRSTSIILIAREINDKMSN